MRKLIVITLGILIGLFFQARPALAHVVVAPKEVGVGARTNFLVSVPTEEEVPTVEVRLVIPAGLQSVRPNVKPGWNIELKKNGEGEEARITEIIWSGGSIPAEQRDEFIFSAQAPAEEATLVWKAYQVYEGGEIVAWENSPADIAEYEETNPQAGEDDHNAPKPYSQTKVVNDLQGKSAGSDSSTAYSQANFIYYFLTVAAFVMSAAALGMLLLKKKGKK